MEREKEACFADNSQFGTRAPGFSYNEREKRIILGAVAKSNNTVKLGGLNFWKELCAKVNLECILLV